MKMAKTSKDAVLCSILKRRISDISKEHLQCCKQIEKLERNKQQLMRESAGLSGLLRNMWKVMQ